MATIRIPEPVYVTAKNHLLGEVGEHFAFFLARWTYSQDTPVFLVHDVILIPDTELTLEWDGYSLNPAATVKPINEAVVSGDCLIEAHNHGGNKPRFSPTDRNGFAEFVPYVHSSLPNRPYAATVWGDDTMYGEFFLPDGRTGRIDSITVSGKQLRQIVSRSDDGKPIEPTFDRQLAWFTEQGQRELGRLRVAIVGCGGTGSHVLQNLAYLGVRGFVLIDRDAIDKTSMNRVVTATASDIGASKATLGQRLIEKIAPAAKVQALVKPLQSPEALDTLKGVDVLFGCIDNDGARLILNEMALAYSIPYFDLAVGINLEYGRITSVGGRVAVILADGPCLHCMNEIDQEEARFALSSPQEQANHIARGYITGLNVDAPSVVSLNAVTAAMAIKEFAVLQSGLRPVNVYTEYDLLGIGRATKSQYISPTIVKQNPTCLVCSYRGLGDKISLERYVVKGKEKTTAPM